MVAGQQSLRSDEPDDLAGIATRFADDPAAFDEAYALLAPGIRRLLLRLLPVDDADDVLQATFTDAWRQRHTYDPARPLRSWLLGIARHRSADEQRARRPVPVQDVDVLAERSPLDGAGSRPAADVAEQVARTELVRSALRTVSTEQREVLVLAYFSGLTQTEIADWLDIPLGTVKARSARGLRAVATRLRGGDGGDS